MSKVIARSVATECRFLEGSDVVRLEYTPRRLIIHVQAAKNTPTAIVEFENILGFRVLDERDLMEYWPVCSTPNGWLFEVQSGGWLSQERERDGSCIAAMNPEAKEYLVTGDDDCVSVLSRDAPVVRENAP
jgi:hypothetical protein